MGSGLGLNSVLLDVLEGVVHKTTIAAHVSVDASSAVNELLLGVGVESTSGKELSTLDGTGGGESPARTALALVLDGGNGTYLLKK